MIKRQQSQLCWLAVARGTGMKATVMIVRADVAGGDSALHIGRAGWSYCSPPWIGGTVSVRADGTWSCASARMKAPLITCKCKSFATLGEASFVKPGSRFGWQIEKLPRQPTKLSASAAIIDEIGVFALGYRRAQRIEHAGAGVRAARHRADQGGGELRLAEDAARIALGNGAPQIRQPARARACGPA